MGEQGFLGTSIAAEKGGIGGTFKDEAIVLEEQIYANCHAPAIGVSNAAWYVFYEGCIFLTHSSIIFDGFFRFLVSSSILNV